MRLLVTNSEQAARDLEAKAEAFVFATVPGALMGQWSDIYVSADGKAFGFAFEDRLAPAFTADDLGTTVTGSGESAVTTYANVTEAVMAQPATDSAPAVPGWSVVPPSPPVVSDQP